MSDARYHRQVILPEIGQAGQQRLADSRVLLVGCGALGCGVADLLVRAGVGALTIVDRDVVERTNLQRQTLFDEHDAMSGASKADAAAKRLRRVNSGVIVRGVVAHFSHRNAESLLMGDYDSAIENNGVSQAVTPSPQLAFRRNADILIDGTDNFLTRYLLNDLAVKHDIPMIYGGAVGTSGMTMTIRPGVTPCLRCIFPDPPSHNAAADSTPMGTCDTAGILAPVSTIIAAMQAIEAIKALTGAADAYSTDLVEIEPWRNQSRRIAISNARSTTCICCVQRRFEFLDGAHDRDASVICTRHGGGAVQIEPARSSATKPAHARVSLDSLAARLRPQGSFAQTPHALHGVLDHESGDGANPIELTVFSDGRVIVRGTTDLGVARAIYSRYVGE